MSVTELAAIEQMLLKKIAAYAEVHDDPKVMPHTRVSCRDTISQLEEILEVVQKYIGRYV